MNNSALTYLSVAVLLGVSSLLGYIGNTAAMPFSIAAGSIGLIFSNIDKIKWFKGAGVIEAEMFHQMEAVLDKETEPEAKSDEISKLSLEKNEQDILIALTNPKYTWRYIGGLSQDSGLSRDKVKSALRSLEKQSLVMRSLNTRGVIWAPSRSGRNVAIKLKESEASL